MSAPPVFLGSESPSRELLLDSWFFRYSGNVIHCYAQTTNVTWYWQWLEIWLCQRIMKVVADIWWAEVIRTISYDCHLMIIILSNDDHHIVKSSYLNTCRTWEGQRWADPTDGLFASSSNHAPDSESSSALSSESESSKESEGSWINCYQWPAQCVNWYQNTHQHHHCCHHHLHCCHQDDTPLPRWRQQYYGDNDHMGELGSRQACSPADIYWQNVLFFLLFLNLKLKLGSGELCLFTCTLVFKILNSNWNQNRVIPLHATL